MSETGTLDGELPARLGEPGLRPARGMAYIGTLLCRWSGRRRSLDLHYSLKLHVRLVARREDRKLSIYHQPKAQQG
jgi:hypothetical protein